MDSGNKPHVEDDKVNCLNIQDAETKKASGEEDDLGNEYVEVDVYDIYNKSLILSSWEH